MSDDLIKRLRDWPTIKISKWRKDTDMRKVEAERSEAADRIEQLERELVAAIEVVAESGRKRGEAEAKLEKAVRIIKRTAAQLDWCQAAKDISKELSTTLAELEGQ